MTANYGSVGGFPHNLNEIGEHEQISEQNNQFPYYPDLWAGQPLGTILREFRRSYGLNLHQVSDTLKIRSVYLDYIEKGEFELLPGYVYGQGFVRSYASYLGLPQDEMLALYKAESFGERTTEPFESVSAALSAERTTPPLGVLLGVIVGVGILLYLAFFLFSRLSFGDGDEASSETQVSFYERISTFIFGTDDVSAPKPAVSADDADLLAGAGPIVVGVDGTISIAPSPKPEAAQIQPAVQPTAPAPEQNTAIAAQESYFPDRKAPRPRQKPDLTAQSIQTAQVRAPRNSASELISNIDPNVPLISPQAVSTGAPAFGQGVGFNSPAVSVTSLPNVVNTTPIIGPRVPVSQPAIIINNQVDEPNPEPEVTPEPTSQAANQAPFVETPEAQPELLNNNTTTIGNTDATDSESRIVIKAVARTWIKVVAPDGSSLAEQLLATNDTFNVPNQDNLTLLTGSLGSLALSVDGRTVQTPASISQRTDTIKLDADALLKQR